MSSPGIFKLGSTGDGVRKVQAALSKKDQGNFQPQDRDTLLIMSAKRYLEENEDEKDPNDPAMQKQKEILDEATARKHPDITDEELEQMYGPESKNRKQWNEYLAGEYGSETHQAVENFQEEEDLNVDGKVGPTTSNALFDDREPEDLDQTSRGGDRTDDEKRPEPDPHGDHMNGQFTDEMDQQSYAPTKVDPTWDHDEILATAGYVDNPNDARYNLYHKLNVYNKTLQDIYSGYEFSHVFITKPELNLFKDGNRGTLSETLDNATMADSVDFRQLVEDNKVLARYLDSTVPTLPDRDPKFIYPLMNLLEEMSSTDVEFSVKSSPANRQGISIDYPTNYMESLSGIPINLTFSTDRYDTVLTMLHIWTMYMSLIQKGFIKPRADAIMKNKFEASCAIYQFVTAEDGETIKFWSKGIGCYPQNIPYSVKAHERKKHIAESSIPISFYVPFFIAMRPSILAEFNNLIGHNSVGDGMNNPNNRSGLPTHIRDIDYHFTDSAAIIKENNKYKLRYFNQGENESVRNTQRDENDMMM